MCVNPLYQMKIISKDPPASDLISYYTIKRTAVDRAIFNCNKSDRVVYDYKDRDFIKIDNKFFIFPGMVHWKKYKLEDFEIGETRYSYLLDVPCGKCLECLNQKATEWSYRIMDECSLHKYNCFITLTYDEAHNPKTLVKKDLQDFIKRLRNGLNRERKKIGLEPIFIRYFGCGEYGSDKNTMRPHYHIIIFGWMPDDLTLLSDDGKTRLYRSKAIEALWTEEKVIDGKKVKISLGFSSVGAVTIHSAKYCAKYLQKLRDVPEGFVQPYICMSLKPGIGVSARSDQSLMSDKIYHEGHYMKIPRYYLTNFERDGWSIFEIKANRVEKALNNPVSDEELKIRKEKIRKLLDKPLNCL